MAIYDPKIKIELENAEKKFRLLINKGKKLELKEVKRNRSTQQNSALHVYFSIISVELNDLGLEYQYTGISGNTFELMYTPDLVKEYIWRPIQVALFKIKSTTKINTNQINEIIDVITKFFADREIVIEFPSIDSLLNKY